MRTPFTMFMAIAIVAFLVTGGLASVVSATTPSDPMDRIRLEQGTTTQFGKGSYVAINCTQGYNIAWFGVIYGTEDSPAPITLVGVNLHYLGGAEVVDANGNVIVSEVPIPIVTVFGQQMFGLLEFDDTGLVTFFGETYGADNGLFDFSTNKRIFEDDATAKYEPVKKYVDLNRAWTLSAIEQDIDYDAQEKTFTFSLYAENVTYSKVWDRSLGVVRDGTPADGVVERIEFRFHITASAREVTAEVPFYQVTVNNGQIVSSEQIAPRNYTGISTHTAFKYDHILNGWDFDENATDPLLMLENGIIYAAFIPDKVEEWYNAQFVEDDVNNGAGRMVYFDDEGQQVVEDQDDLPQNATLLTKDRITFEGNWERTGALTWVSNVTVDGEENRMMTYQIHAGDRSIGPSENNDGEVRALFVLGGYIYPAGEYIMHDPLLEVGSIQLEMEPSVQALVFLAIIGVVIIVAIIVAMALIIRNGQKRKGNFQGQVPPPFRP